jgi:hypothetical protein
VQSRCSPPVNPCKGGRRICKVLERRAQSGAWSNEKEPEQGITEAEQQISAQGRV